VKKNVGAVVGLYPTPVTIIGTVIDSRVNWINIAHVGIIALDRISISMHKSHYSNQGLTKGNLVSVNLVSEKMLAAADYVGMVSGAKVDKSKVFEYESGSDGEVPLIKDSPLVMECRVVDNYKTESHDHFILKVEHTHVEEENLNSSGKIDYEKVRPILFEMPTRTYLKTGDVVGKCWSEGKNYK